jgi:ATP-binding cassette subfamily B protein
VQAVVVDLRTQLYDRLQRFGLRFFEDHRCGTLINRVVGDVHAIGALIDGVAIPSLAVVLSLVVYVNFMLHVHVGLTLACLATTPPLWAAAVMFSRHLRPAYKMAGELADRLLTTLSESVQGIQVTKCFGREADRVAAFAAANDEVARQKQEIFCWISIFQPFSGLLTHVNTLVLLAYGGQLVIRGELPLGEGLFVFANLLNQFANQVAQIANIANTTQSSLAAARRVSELLGPCVETCNHFATIRPSALRGAVRFERVAFAYRRGEMVLNDLNLVVEPGQRVAIVGAMACGKSTLLNLVPRFIDPTSGSVLIDGHDARELDLDALRRRVGMVFQDTFLFRESVAANIAYGAPGVNRSKIEHLARIAAAHRFIMALPSGYDTLVGEMGVNLSGGERQRLSIARALAIDPAILILDDATSAIDAMTERELLDGVFDSLSGRTVLVATHRPSVLKRCDVVFVLDRGRIVDQGSHAGLVRRHGQGYASATEVANTCDTTSRPCPVSKGTR